ADSAKGSHPPPFPDAGRQIDSQRADARYRFTAGPHQGEQRLHAMDAVPEEIRMGGLERAGAVHVAPFTSPIFPPRIACALLTYLSDDEENTETLYCRAASKIATASVSDPAIGLSMKTVLPALSTGSTCSRCGRPSFVS